MKQSGFPQFLSKFDQPLDNVRPAHSLVERLTVIQPTDCAQERGIPLAEVIARL
jgi:hypothetical protein